MRFKYSILLLLALNGCSGFWPFGERDNFVTVSDLQFFHNDEPYYFVGTNLWYACYLGSPGMSGDRTRLLRELDSLQSLGITNIRLLAGSEKTIMKRTLSPSITVAPGRFDDSLLLGLDFTIAEMAKRKMKAVLFLTNFWEWSGGMAQYIVWSDNVPTFDPEVDGWDGFMNFSSSFYKNEKANVLYRSFIRSIITRKNTRNGRIYNQDPTIMSWQLANEPRPGTISQEGLNNIPHFLRWINETAGYIKSLDTNHLVSTGSEGIIGSLRNEDVYRSAHMSKHIDYMTMHLWPSIWKWFDPQEQEKTLPLAMDSSKEYINQHLRVAQLSGKPLVLEEFGMVRDNGGYAHEIPIRVRDHFYSEIFSLIYDSAKAGAPIAGSNFWAWGGEGRTLNPDYLWRVGDPFTGDPPHEHQGMHSIFNSDTSTKNIIRYYAKKMNCLGKDDQLFTHREKMVMNGE